MLKNLSRNQYIILGILFVVLLLLAFQVNAGDITPGYLGSEKDAESALGKIGKKVVEWVLYLAVVLASIAAGAGLAQANGLFGNKEKGIEMVKTGLAIMAISGSALGIFAFFAGLGN